MSERIYNHEGTDYPVFVKRKKITRWSIFGIILLSSSLMIFYINNVRRVNDILRDISFLEDKYKIIKMQNIILKAKVNELESPDRIIRIGEEALNMELQDKPPIIINNKR